MRKWQLLEFDGKPYYAFVPEEDESPIKEDHLPEYSANSPDDGDRENDGHDYDYDDDDSDVGDISGDVRFSGDEDDLDDDIADERDRKAKRKGDEEEDSKNKKKKKVANEKAKQSRASPTAKVAATRKKMKKDEGGKAASETNKKQQQERFGNLYHLKMEGNQFKLEQVSVRPIAKQEDEEKTDQPKPSLKSAPLFKCKACSETFDTLGSFKKHVAWAHKRKVCVVEDNGSYSCSVCDFSSDQKSEFAEHLRSNHQTAPATPAAGKGRGKRGAKKQQAGSSGAFMCAACGFEASSKHSLQSHFARKHTDTYEHQCSQCPKKFKVKSDLTNHVRFAHKEKPVQCNVCSKVCPNTGSLYVHQKWAHFRPEHECPICKRRMVSAENLQEHIKKQHEQREKIVCQECGKVFGKKDSFKRHMSVHTGARPFKCVICNKSFARRSQVRQHLLIHTGKRCFSCDICGKKFTQKPGLICHRKTHPGDHPPLPVMPIGEIVKEFMDDYLASKEQKKTPEVVAVKEALERLDEEEAEEDEEEYEREEEEEYDEDVAEEEEMELEFEER